LRTALIERAKAFSALILTALLLASPGCLVRRVTHIHAPNQGGPVLEASLAELVGKINAWSVPIHTMNLTVDLAPTAGSVYSGALTEYRDVKGFILLQRPATIRLQGQAPVIRTNIFDMVSNGEEFRLYIPAKHKFIIGKTSFHRRAKNPLENLRPQHISQALIVPPIEGESETPSFRVEGQSRTQRRRYYEVYIVDSVQGHHSALRRIIWFDRADLALVRMQFYEPDGTYTEDVRYSYYQDFQGVHFPTHIEITRPAEDYEVTITVENAKFNEAIPAEKFELQKPDGVDLVDLSASEQREHPGGQ